MRDRGQPSIRGSREPTKALAGSSSLAEAAQYLCAVSFTPPRDYQRLSARTAVSRRLFAEPAGRRRLLLRRSASDDDYQFGSFVQSKMYEQGVTCTDCHDPHSGKLSQENTNAVCGQCHSPTRFANANHHHHKADSRGRAVRELSHAGEKLHGGRRRARSQFPRAASGSLSNLRHPECLQSVPQR